MRQESEARVLFLPPFNNKNSQNNLASFPLPIEIISYLGHIMSKDMTSLF